MRRAFTLLELIVALFIVAVLVSIMIPSLSVARRRSHQANCSANLVAMAHAVQNYANDNAGWVPRDYGMQIETREPGWPVQLGKYLLRGREVDRERLWEYEFYRCPAHPVERAATSYVLNAFAFDTAPDWRPSGPVRIARIRKPAALPWIADCGDAFGAPDPNGLLLDAVYRGHNHDLWSPDHLPPAPHSRLAVRRHGPNINILYLDGHVGSVNSSELKIEDFDDGLRQRVDKANW